MFFQTRSHGLGTTKLQVFDFIEVGVDIFQ